MLKKIAPSLAVSIVNFFFCFQLYAQPVRLTKTQQVDDFAIFKAALQEGHAGLYYFIDRDTFAQKCDSIEETFTQQATLTDYYLKLRYLITLLCHGHTRINLPDHPIVSFKMAVLNPKHLYLPLRIGILNKKVYVIQDCSLEQSLPEGAEIIKINGVATQHLLNKMIAYLPADGINTTFKYYNLYNYFYFHFLYNLFYPSIHTFDLEVAGAKRTFRIQGRTPAAIEKTHQNLTKQSTSHFDNPLQYNPTIGQSTAYLRVGSFYKGFIERFGSTFISFMDSTFADLRKRGTKQLILDLRNNEGGGDRYNDYLFAHINPHPFIGSGMDQVAGRKFNQLRYAYDLDDEFKAYLANPAEFLRNDTSLVLKPEYTDGKVKVNPAQNLFTGRIYVLINGGTFSAANFFIRHLYNYRLTNTSPQIVFIGEENGGDIYSNVQTGGKSYRIRLPNSSISVEMPLLTDGQLNRKPPAKRLPDYPVTASIEDVLAGRDGVLGYALTLCEQ